MGLSKHHISVKRNNALHQSSQQSSPRSIERYNPSENCKTSPQRERERVCQKAARLGARLAMIDPVQVKGARWSIGVAAARSTWLGAVKLRAEVNDGKSSSPVFSSLQLFALAERVSERVFTGPRGPRAFFFFFRRRGNCNRALFISRYTRVPFFLSLSLSCVRASLKALVRSFVLYRKVNDNCRGQVFVTVVVGISEELLLSCLSDFLTDSAFWRSTPSNQSLNYLLRSGKFNAQVLVPEILQVRLSRHSTETSKKGNFSGIL